MFLSCTGLGYLIWSATVSALNHLDDVMVKVQGGTTNLQELSDIVGSKMLNTYSYHNAAFLRYCLPLDICYHRCL